MRPIGYYLAVSRLTDAMMALIHADMADSEGWNHGPPPVDIGAFSFLHDYCDANMQYIDAIVPLPGFADETADEVMERWTELTNTIVDEADRRLAQEAEALHAGGFYYSPWQVVRTEQWGMLPAEPLPIIMSVWVSCDLAEDYISRHNMLGKPYAVRFALPCPGCGGELEDAGPFDGTLASSGVTDGHEGFGDTLMCFNDTAEANRIHDPSQGTVSRFYVFLQGRLVPPEHVLTVVEGRSS